MESGKMEMCSVGEVTRSNCHLLTYVRKKDVKSIESLTENDLTLLKLRIESSDGLKTICLHHQSMYLQKYEFLQKVCCDPLKEHNAPIKTTLRVVSLEQSKIISAKGYKV